MDADQFDSLTTRLTTHLSRRRLGLLGLLAGTGLVGDTAAKKKKKKPKKCKPACGACQECDKGKCKSVANGKACGSGNTCQGGVCTPVTPAGCSQDNQVCNGDGRCLKGTCKPKPTCAPIGAQHIPDDSFQCCSGNMECKDVAPFGTVCTCVQHPYDATTGNACLSDQDCAGGECVGYQCRWCSGEDCPPVYEYWRSFGSYGTGPGQLTDPNALAITPDSTLLVSDGAGFRVLEFTLNGSLVRTIGTGVQGNGNNQFVYPRAIAVDEDGNIYVGESYRVQKFSRTGVYLRTFGVTNVGGSDNHHLTYVSGLAFDSQGLLYISDNGDSNNSYARVQVFRTDGTYVRTITKAGEPYFGEIAINANDHLFVLNDESSALLEFGLNGVFLGRRPLTDYPNSGYSEQFAFGPDGSCFACRQIGDDEGRTMVVQYSPNWEKVREFFSTTEPSPPAGYRMSANGVAVDTAGNLFIADVGWVNTPAPFTQRPRIVEYSRLTTGGHSRDTRSSADERKGHQGVRHGSRRRQHKK
ncbi:MAG: NHL repeat-containing protein [Thermomicrobiales bacterium]